MHAESQQGDTSSAAAAVHRERASALIAQRNAGVCMHLASLPGPHGIGEIGRNAHGFMQQMAAAGLSVWQFLPTGPTAYGDSPYQPLSTYAGNPMLIEMRALAELGLLDDDELAPLTKLPTDFIDYGTLIPIKTGLLRLAASRFRERSEGSLTAQYDAFVDATDRLWLHDYALFRTLKSMHGDRPWPEWAAEYRRRDPDALATLAQSHGDDIFAVKFNEFIFDLQWRALRDAARRHGITLFGDMPIYIALDSADAWANTEMLRLDEDGKPSHVAGVPPDYFSADGQLWGNPLYDWDYHRRTGFRWWIERMRHTMTLVDIVRIDHFRGFEAYWAVPYGETTARGGTWEPGPNDEVFDAMYDALGELPIVAEDLGEITPAVDALRMRQGMPGMTVLQFEVGEPGFRLDQIAVDSVCYTGTHDNDTTVGWFRGGNNDVRTDEQVRASQQATLAATGGSADDVHWALIETAFASAACLAIVPMQDFLGLGSEARLNLPGSSANNWRWRLGDDDFSATLRQRIRELATRYRR